MMLRLSLTVLALLVTIILPWWISIIFLLSLIGLFPWCYGAMLPAFTFDLIYGSGYFWLTIGVLILIPLAEIVKERLYVFH